MASHGFKTVHKWTKRLRGVVVDERFRVAVLSASDEYSGVV